MAIAFGSINVPEVIVNMEVEMKGVDISQEVLPASAQSFAIATPSTQADPTGSTQEEQQQEMLTWRTRTTSKQNMPTSRCPKTR